MNIFSKILEFFNLPEIKDESKKDEREFKTIIPQMIFSFCFFYP